MTDPAVPIGTLPEWQPAARDDPRGYFRTERLTVPGGWLYRVVNSAGGGSNAVALWFVSERFHAD